MTAASVIVTNAGGLGGSSNGILRTILSPITAPLSGLAGLGLSAIVAWVLGGAKAALMETAHIISLATAPQLSSAWFSSTYWRVAGLAAVLTVPFLCAAAVQAVIHANMAMLTQAALIYLPMALIGVSLAAPVVMLLLAATDQMCAVVAGAGVGGGANFLRQAAGAAGEMTSIGGSPFFAVFVGLCTVAAAIVLTMEMLVRESAVYVVVLMLPLVFAALVWPARRIWASRLVELLVALILSKFAIVAVLSLAGAAYGSSGAPSGSRALTAMALVLLSTFAPWAMLRLLPFTELASSAVESISAHGRRVLDPSQIPSTMAEPAVEWATSLPGSLLAQAGEAGQLDDAVPAACARDRGSASPEPGGFPIAGAGSRGGVAELEVSDEGAWSGPADDGAAAEPSESEAPPAGQPSSSGASGSPAVARHRSEIHPAYKAGHYSWPPMHLDGEPWDGLTAYHADDSADRAGATASAEGAPGDELSPPAAEPSLEGLGAPEPDPAGPGAGGDQAL